MNRFILIFCSVLAPFTVRAQIYLQTEITSPSQPRNREFIHFKTMMQYAPVSDFNFTKSGPFRGAVIPDFTLYTPEGAPVNITSLLLNGKPVLMIAGSYTCGEFRGNIPQINNIARVYKDSLKVLIVYTNEAHPIDENPYTGKIWYNNKAWFQENVSENILFRQPKTYGERRRVARKLIRRMDLAPQLVIDGPGNEWWHYFGPAPNNAFLIDIDGTIYSKQAWLNRDHDICDDIDKLLYKIRISPALPNRPSL